MIQMSNYDENMENAIAIIGMAGRFPGAKSLEEFWQNLYNGKESVKFFSREELLKMGIDKNLLDNPRFVAADAVLDDIDKFDASFFGYSAREAEIMDPQHRLFLEKAWEVLETAGYNSEFYDGKIAVYAGANLSSYMIRNIYSNPGLVQRLGSFKIMLANGQDFVATKVSHKLNLTGPSVNVNTLCSSSMVAVHYACENLLNFGCDIALAGGVSLQVTRNEALFYQEGGIGSSDGHCRAFDSRANGTVSGSGLAIVCLKRLEDAIEDGDCIQAVIRGTAVNNDGAIKNSYTAPSVDGQSQCIAEAIAMSGVDPETITYVDAHGTGTNLGDPIEIAAITKAFRAYTDKKQYCGIGSVKTNIGHLVHAGGLASLVKVVLSMQHGMIPPSLNFEEPNPKIDFVNSPFYVNTKLSKWESDGPRRAGVSSFGIGGTNTHTILEEAPKREKPEKSNRPSQLVVLSAKTPTALEKMTSNLVSYLKKHPDIDAADVAFTLGVGRKNFNNRRALICGNTAELIEKLERMSPDDVFTHSQKEKEQHITFVFPGEGCAYSGMGSQLYKSEGAFRKAVDKCAKILEPMTGFDIRTRMFETAETADSAILRCGLFVTEYALAKMLKKWEITPELMIGDGIGELAAACIAGVFSLEDALKIALKGAQAVSNAQLEAPKTAFVSCATGKKISDAEAQNPNYWTSLFDGPNNFSAALEKLLKDSNNAFVVAGPSIKGIESSENRLIISAMPESLSVTGEQPFLFKNVAKFWVNGGKVNWYKFYDDEKRLRMPLPTYPFERERYWIEPGKAAGAEQNDASLDIRPRPDLETEYVAPRTETEKTIAAICGEILGYDRIGVNDDFFDLGGHSLLAVAFIAKMRKVFKKNITLEVLFENTTVAKLAAIYDSMDEENENNSDDFDEGIL
jgi:phthiocerol/phenolphthiocerol synthesis type-I polyketide synthase E